MSKEKVLVKWYCGILNKTITTDKNAIYLTGYGWICDCGNWIKDDDKNHKILLIAERETYQIDLTTKFEKNKKAENLPFSADPPPIKLKNDENEKYQNKK